MAIDKLVAPLLRVPLFCGLKPLQLTEIARQAERISLSARQHDHDKRARPATALTSSSPARPCACPSGSRAAEPIEPGSLVGELAMLIEHVYGATIVAQGRVHCLKITAPACTSRCATTRHWPSTFTRLWLSR